MGQIFTKLKDFKKIKDNKIIFEDDENRDFSMKDTEIKLKFIKDNLVNIIDKNRFVLKKD